MAKTELEKAISAVKFRDDNSDKYVFDITANRRIGSGMESVDLIMKKSGAETLQRAADYAKENEFETLHIVLYKNKQAKEKISEYDIPLFESERNDLSGVETPAVQQNTTANEADRFFQSFGGLGGFMNETRNQIGNQLDLQYARRDLSKAESQIVALETKNESLTAKNEELREQIKALKDQVHDLERDMGYQKNNYEQRTNVLQLAANGIVGFVGSQLGVTPEKLSGFLGLNGTTEPETSQQQPQQQAAEPQHQVENSEKQQYIDAIVDYCYSLDDQKIGLIAGIVQYAGQSPRHLAQVFEYCRTQQNKQNGTESNNDTD
ncbi:MAG: hypothetical protein II956_16020 [Bacteroidales bacterium]|nr:hypothetical protein [Bacteroidales bacterium]